MVITAPSPRRPAHIDLVERAQMLSRRRYPLDLVGFGVVWFETHWPRLQLGIVSSASSCFLKSALSPPLPPSIPSNVRGCYRGGSGLRVLVWFGSVWFGLVWSGLFWFGLVCFGLFWFVLVCFGLVWFGLVWFGLVWFGLAWFGLVWFGFACFRLVLFGLGKTGHSLA